MVGPRIGCNRAPSLLSLTSAERNTISPSGSGGPAYTGGFDTLELADDLPDGSTSSLSQSDLRGHVKPPQTGSTIAAT